MKASELALLAVVADAKPDNLNLVPQAHMEEAKNQLTREWQIQIETMSQDQDNLKKQQPSELRLCLRRVQCKDSAGVCAAQC